MDIGIEVNHASQTVWWVFPDDIHINAYDYPTLEDAKSCYMSIMLKDMVQEAKKKGATTTAP